MGVSISEFRGEYYFLSNFYSAPVTYNGMCFENNEAAFQAAKCPERMTEFCRLNPSEAKRLGRRVKLRGDWEAVKDTVMYEICKAKFSQNPDLADKLVATNFEEIKRKIATMNTDELIEFCGGDTCENVLCSFVSDGDCCGNNCKVSYDCGDCIKKFLQRETRVVR